MEYIQVTKENIEKEHICCAISSNKDIQVSSKKAWLSERDIEKLDRMMEQEQARELFLENLFSIIR